MSKKYIGEGRLTEILTYFKAYFATLGSGIKYVSVAEYEALTDEEKKSGVYYQYDAQGSTISSNDVIITQEEYDALPDSKNTDGISYYISNGGLEGYENAESVSV